MAGGLTSDGFEIKTVEEILEEIGEEQLAIIDPALDISPDQPLGQINGIYASKLAELWEAVAVAYNAFNRGAAEGFLLDAIGLLTGTLRLPATKSQVTATVNLAATTTLSAGVVANVSGQPSVRFVLTEDVTSTSSGNYPANFEAEVTGPVAANAGTLTVIATPAAGWNSVTNALDADLGTDIETDAAYRLRQITEQTAAGSCTVDAIRADLLRIPGILQAFVFENTTMTTDGDGVPPKAYECVVYDGVVPDVDDEDIGQVIWDNKPSGIETYGDTSVNVVDSTGATRTVEFSRGTNVPIYMTYTLGQDVVALVFKSVALNVTGVLDVTAFTLGFSASPVGTTNLTIGSREIAVLDTSRIVVNS